MSNKEFMKVYHMPFKAQEIKYDNFTNFTLQFEQAFEEMTKSFSKQKDEIIINYLYEKYKDTKVSDVWVLSKPDFEKFLLEMLPKWKEPKQYVDELKLVEKERKALEIIKTKSKKNYNLALVVDSGTYEQYCEQFKYFLDDYKEKAGAFEIWEEDKFSFEEYNLLREVFVYEQIN